MPIYISYLILFAVLVASLCVTSAIFAYTQVHWYHEWCHRQVDADLLFYNKWRDTYYPSAEALFFFTYDPSLLSFKQWLVYRFFWWWRFLVWLIVAFATGVTASFLGL